MENDCWETLNSTIKTKRFGFGAAVLNGKIYVCGGSSNFKRLNSVEVYDPTTDRYLNDYFVKYSRMNFCENFAFNKKLGGGACPPLAWFAR